jgi:hypothetical protein
MRNYLFIGGSQDGMRNETDGYEIHRVILPAPTPEFYTSPGYDSRPEDVDFRTETYVLRLFSILGRDVEVYILNGITPHDVAGLLISRYAKP